MRFTLPKLFLAITLAAVACAGIVSPTHLSGSVVFTVTVALFAIVVLRSFALQGSSRVFALVFAIAGALYLAAVFCQPFRVVGKTLLTNYPIAAVAAGRFDELSFGGGGLGGGGFGGGSLGSGGGLFGGATATTSVTTTQANGTQTNWTVTPPVAATWQTYPLNMIIRYGNGFESEEYENVVNFFTVCHCIWSWLIALSAAWFACRMYAKRTRTGGPTGNSPDHQIGEISRAT